MLSERARVEPARVLARKDSSTQKNRSSSAYLRGTYNEGITYCDPGEERRYKLTGWVDSDFAADPDMRKSMTGYLFSLNGGAVSWRSSGVTLRSAEAAYLRALLRGFNFRQVGATEIWEPKVFLAQPFPTF